MAMKTTLNIDDALLRRAKETAARRAVTLTRFLEEAIQAHLEPKRSAKPARLRWVVVKDESLPRVDVADRRALYDLLDPP